MCLSIGNAVHAHLSEVHGARGSRAALPLKESISRALSLLYIELEIKDNVHFLIKRTSRPFLAMFLLLAL